jgi:hypothetical protein
MWIFFFIIDQEKLEFQIVVRVNLLNLINLIRSSQVQ